MPKAKTIKWCLLVAWVWGCAASVQAQPVLGQVIDQTKQLKQRQLTPEKVKSEEQEVLPPPPPPPPALWSITGINNQLVAEIWQGDQVHRLPLEKGAKLPNGWQVVDFDKQSVTFKQGKARHKLVPAARGSTGWEYPQTPKTVPVANAASSSSSSVNSPAGRTSASNLPPAAMLSGGFPNRPSPNVNAR